VAKAPPNLSESVSSPELMMMEGRYAARNYAPMPIVFSKAQGVHVWDPEGKRYYDFLSAYSATNQGHNHPRLVEAMKKQLDACALSSRAFFNSVFPVYARYITKLTGYDRLMPANSGAEAVEVAMKMARKWAYRVKGVQKDEAVIVACEQNFHGRTISVITMSDDPDARKDYGPFTPGYELVPFGDLGALERMLQAKGDKVAAFIVEPIQGEAGVFVPPEGYLRKAHALCKQHNVLLIADEVQTGFGRTGKLFCSDYDEIKPDAIVMGKALSGGLYPVSGVIADESVMGVFEPGTHGSTFGGSPIASAVAIESLKVLVEEGMVENSFKLGERFRAAMSAWAEAKRPVVQLVRGRGLLNAIVVGSSAKGSYGDEGSAWELCLRMAEHGLLAKPTHGDIIRFAPPLVISETQMMDCINIIKETITELEH